VCFLAATTGALGDLVRGAPSVGDHDVQLFVDPFSTGVAVEAPAYVRAPGVPE